MEHWSTAIGGEPRVAGVLADMAFSHPKEVVPPMLFNPSASTARMDSLLLHTQLSPAEVRNSLTRLTDTGKSIWILRTFIDCATAGTRAWRPILLAPV